MIQLCNFMQVTPSKLQFILLKHTSNKEVTLQCTEVNDNNIPCDKQVQMLGRTTDKTFYMEKHS